MPLTFTTLGQALLHIYDFDFGGAIYLPNLERYDVDTPCIVASPVAYIEAEEVSLHQACLDYGFKNWLNIALVSDTCDDVSEKTEPCLVAAFNEDCREDGWLRKWMNYRKEDEKGS